MNRIACIAGIICLLGMTGGAAAAQVDHHGGRVDDNASAEKCLTCHDGSMAKIVSFCTVKCDFKTAHSLFKHYPPRRRAGDFAPASTVKAKGIRLQHRKVTCVSCHNLQNRSAYHLVGTNNEKNICTICHITK